MRVTTLCLCGNTAVGKDGETFIVNYALCSFNYVNVDLEIIMIVVVS